MSHIEFEIIASNCNLKESEIRELVEYTFHPLMDGNNLSFTTLPFSMESLYEAAKIKHHFDLDIFTMSILIKYLQKIEDLEDLNLKLTSEMQRCKI